MYQKVWYTSIVSYTWHSGDGGSPCGQCFFLFLPCVPTRNKLQMKKQNGFCDGLCIWNPVVFSLHEVVALSFLCSLARKFGPACQVSFPREPGASIGPRHSVIFGLKGQDAETVQKGQGKTNKGIFSKTRITCGNDGDIFRQNAWMTGLISENG